MIPVHPEAVAGSPAELRWVMPAGTLEFVGEVTRCPSDLQALVDDGLIVGVVVEPTAVRIALREGRSWRTAGAGVRLAVQAALAEPGGWGPRVAGNSDDVLRAAVDDVIGGEVGDYIRSHGGVIDVVDVRAGRVEVSLSGACTHCPASDITLTGRFEDAVRSRFPALLGVSVAGEPGVAGGRRLLGLLPIRTR